MDDRFGGFGVRPGASSGAGEDAPSTLAAAAASWTPGVGWSAGGGAGAGSVSADDDEYIGESMAMDLLDEDFGDDGMLDDLVGGLFSRERLP